MARGKKTGGRQKGVPNKATRELKELAREYAPAAIETLQRIMLHGTQEAARIAAARELLDRGYGKAAQAVTGANDQPLIPPQIIHQHEPAFVPAAFVAGQVSAADDDDSSATH